MKKIILSEKTEKRLFELLLNESINGLSDKVGVVKNYLDQHWLKADMTSVNDFDECEKKYFVIAKDANGQPYMVDDEPLKKTTEELFELLQAKFKHLFGSDTEQRDKFLKQVIYDWYNNKISKSGNLTKY